MQYLIFCAWLTFLNKITCNNTLLGVGAIFTTFSSSAPQWRNTKVVFLSWLWLSAAAINMEVHTSLPQMDFISLDTYPEVGLLDQTVVLFLDF